MWGPLGRFRRFGLGPCDLPTLLRGVATMLRLLALQIDRTAKEIPTSMYGLMTLSTLSYLYIFHVSGAWFVLVRCRATGDKLAAIAVFTTATTSLIAITKLLCMYIYREKVQSMVAELIEFDKLPVAPATSALLATRLRAVRKRALVFGVVVMGNAVLFNLQPLFKAILKPGRHLLYDEQVLYGLEPMLETPNYEIAMVNITICVILIASAVSFITALLIITMGYCEARLLAQSQEVMSLWDDAIQYYKENFDVNFKEDTGDKTVAMELNKYVKQRLQVIIKSHATNVNIIKKVNVIFSGAIVAEFILLVISLIADLLGGLEKTFLLLPFSLMQVSMDCYTGQRLMDASIVFEKAVYECKWESFDASNMKTVQVMLQISQKTLNVSAGGVATLSFECLMSLMKFVYSTYTTLRSSM